MNDRFPWIVGSIYCRKRRQTEKLGRTHVTLGSLKEFVFDRGFPGLDGPVLAADEASKVLNLSGVIFL